MANDSSVFRRWECGTCKKLQGILYPREQVLTLKFKNLICWVKGEVEIVCRYCGSKNSIRTDGTVEELLDLPRK